MPQSEAPPADAAITYDGAPGQLVEAPRIAWYLRGVGGVHSTGLDLLRWHRALQGDALLGDQAKAKLYQTEIGDYACGWHVQSGPHGKVLWHRGTIFGQQAMLKRCVDADMVVVFVINRRTGWLRLPQDLVEEMIDGADRELPPLPYGGGVARSSGAVPAAQRRDPVTSSGWRSLHRRGGR